MDSYIYGITALLPLVATMLVCQANPYRALVIRGILGAVAALVYTVLGAADVALTEALVGTLLAITLYAVAVRSSMVLRLGVLKVDAIADSDDTSSNETSDFKELIDSFRRIFDKRYMRIELIPYLDQDDLYQALQEKDVHAICARSEAPYQATAPEPPIYHTTLRLYRLYEILQTELSSPITQLTYVSVSEVSQPGAGEKQLQRRGS